MCATDAARVTRCTGTIANGAPYAFEKPASWNGTLLVYSRGGPVVIVPPAVAPNGTRLGVLDHGYALLAS